MRFCHLKIDGEWNRTVKGAEMSFWKVLDTLLIGSLELFFELVYVWTNKMIHNPGMSIVILSLFMNFLVLPLYMRADAIQEEENALERKLQRGVDHIKKTFHGDERMMILQTYYRQNHYKPVYVLRSAISLFLQIPFFVAAYRFLSGLSLLSGVSFGPITDLSRPDGLLQAAGVSINLLPFIMTAVNLISCIIFTKGSPAKAKIQLYAMALFFLVFLYNSPSGLVFYWTLNNVFSLGKTICYKLKDPGLVLGILFSAGGIMAAAYGYLVRRPPILWKILFIAGIAVAMQTPLAFRLLRSRLGKKTVRRDGNRKLFFGGAAFLAILTGTLIPSAVIGASPLEFVKLTDFYNPLWYILSSTCLAFGIFVIWAGIFYFLAKPAVRAYFDRGIWILVGIALVNYLFFGKNLGLLSTELTYEKGVEFARSDQLKNVAVLAGVSIILYLGYRYKEKIAADISVVGAATVFCMALINVSGINTEIDEVKERKLENYETVPELTLSKSGKNVIVFMLDRAIGEYVPYIFREKPDLKEQFSGFTYYANTVSFGSHTTFGVPPLFGGYEYTPVEMNKRGDELLGDKHDEALKVMPVLFDQNGYQVTVCDPPYAGYKEIPDLSIFDQYPGIHSYILKGKFTEDTDNERVIRDRHRNFFCFSVMKAVPLCLQNFIYDSGNYNRTAADEMEKAIQVPAGPYHAAGLEAAFMDSYNVLAMLSDMTKVTDEECNSFLMLENDTTHDPVQLQEPDYVPAEVVDNEEYETNHQERYTLNGRTLRMVDSIQLSTYQINMAALIQMGEWFDYMRENDVYDNTRIILASDHGRGKLYEADEYRLGENDDMLRYYPLLMVKDFDSKEFVISEEFMTNGDVPTLALEGIVEDPINPFTGNEINSCEKTAHDQYIITSDKFLLEWNDGTTYLPSTWYAVHDDMRDADNWRLLSEEETVLPPVEE